MMSYLNLLSQENCFYGIQLQAKSIQKPTVRLPAQSPPHTHSRHSGIMHFSACDVSALHMEPSAGLILTIRCRFFMPIPQVALQSSHSPHSVTRQLLGARKFIQLEFCSLCQDPPACPTYLQGTPFPNSQHSSLTVHFSVSSVGSVHTEPSSGNCLTYLSRDLMPMPHEMLQGDQVIHSDMVQVEPSGTQRACSGGHALTLRGEAPECVPQVQGTGPAVYNCHFSWGHLPDIIVASFLRRRGKRLQLHYCH